MTTRIATPVSRTSPSMSCEDLAAHRGVEARDRLVGDEQLGLEHHRARDHDALALAAGDLVRVEAEEPLGRAQAGARERGRDELLLVALDLLDAQPLGDRLVDRLARVERAGRVLEDHLHLRAGTVGARAVVVADRLAAEADLARARALEPEDRARERRLAAARLADEREHLARADGEVRRRRRRARPRRGAREASTSRSRDARAAGRRRRPWSPPRGPVVRQRLPVEHPHARRPPPGPAGHSSIAAREHTGRTSGQRGWNGQPDGQVARVGRVAGQAGRVPSGTPGPRSPGTRRRAHACTGARAAANTSRSGPSSTIRPAYMTASRRQTAASVDRSWVMNRTASPNVVCRSRSSRSTWACTITSSAVVGSSATSSRGSHASASAISTRWRWPPESWCG